MQQTSMQEKNNLGKQRGGISMFKKMKHMKNEKGLTLIELLAVIVILAIIAAIAIPAIGNIINNQRDKALLAELSNAISTAEIAYVDGTCGTSGTCLAADLSFTSTKFTLVSVSGLPSAPTVTISTAPTWKGNKFTFSGTSITKSELNTKMGNSN